MRTRNLVFLLAAGAAVAACSGGDREEAAHRSGAPSVDIPAAVPADAAALAVVQPPGTLRKLWRTGLLGELDPERAEALDDELEGYIEQEYGVVIGDVSSGFVYVLPDEVIPSFAFGVSGIHGEPAAPQAGDHGGVPLYAAPDMEAVFAVQDDLLLVGDERAVTAGLDVATGEAEPLSEDSELGRLVAEDIGEAYLSLAAVPDVIPDPEVQMMSEQFGVRAAALSIGSGTLAVIARGDDDGLDDLASLIEVGLSQGVSMAKREKDAVVADGLPEEAIGAILAIHHFEALAAEIEPTVADGKLEIAVEIEAGNPALLVGVVGIGAALAVPAFLDYQERAKAAEAEATMRSMVDLVRMYHAEHGELPPSAPLTPANPLACCGGCEPDPEAWSGEGWQALGFEMLMDHRFSYGYERVDDDAFTIRAGGAPGCEGEIHHRGMTGTVSGDEILVVGPRDLPLDQLPLGD